MFPTCEVENGWLAWERGRPTPPPSSCPYKSCAVGACPQDGRILTSTSQVTMAKPKAKRAPFKNADADFSKTGHPRKTRLTLFRRATLLHKNYGAAVYLLVKFQEKYWAYSSAPKPTHHEHQHELSTDLEAENERLTALVQDLQVQLAQKQNSDLAPHSSATATGNVDPLTGPRSPSFPPSLSYIVRQMIFRFLP